MRKYALLIAAIVAVLALPSSASAAYTCPPPPGPDTPTGGWVNTPDGGYVHYYQGHSHYGWPVGGGPSHPVGGVCWSTGAQLRGQGFNGGSVEAAADTNDGTVPTTTGPGDSTKPGNAPGAYVIIEGDDGNATPDGESDGYIGVSNYESNAGHDGDCSNGPDQDPDKGSNAGWCTWVKPAGPGVWTPIVGGSDSGKSYDDTSRDGWAVP